MAGGTVIETTGSVGAGGAGGGGTVTETTGEVGAGAAAAQVGTLATTGQGLLNRAESSPAATGGIAGLIALLAAAYIKRREILSRFLR